MSGLELILPTVLGVIPLILEAYDHFPIASSAIAAFKNYPQQIRTIHTVLRTQETTFRTNVILLLSTITDNPSLVHRLLAESSPVDEGSWRQLNINQTCKDRAEVLKDSFECCSTILREINDIVRTLKTVLPDLRDLCRGAAHEEDVNQKRKWTKQISDRYRLATNRSRVDKTLQNLRSFTYDFDRTTNQIIRILKNTEKKATQFVRPLEESIRTLHTVAEYNEARKAAMALGESMIKVWCCNCESAHIADICLNSPASRKNGNLATLQFQMVLTSNPTNIATTNRSRPLWLKVHCDYPVKDIFALKREQNSTGQLLEIEKNLLSQCRLQDRDEAIGCNERPRHKLSKKRKTVHFEGDYVCEEQESSKPSSKSGAGNQILASDNSNEQLLSDSIGRVEEVDIATIPDVCNYFRQSAGTEAEKIPLRYDSDQKAYHFYQSVSDDCSGGDTSRSLNEIVRWVAEDHVLRALQRSMIAQLACALSEQVLQFHGTWWLQRLWTSADVHFFGPDTLSSSSLKRPFLRATLLEQTPDTLPSALTTSPSVPGSRNDELYSFGIILLEIGLLRPWLVLRQHASSSLPRHQASDYFAADFLARSPLLLNQMGPHYCRIVRQCLGCDFGLGERDLESSSLQEAFLMDVIESMRQVMNGLDRLK